MKKNVLLFALLCALASCKSYNESVIQSNIMSSSGEVVFYSERWNFVTVKFECDSRPWKLRLCQTYINIPSVTSSGKLLKIGDKVVINSNQ